jgi:3-oxoacyl-[acyl-carrier protein] reductase
MATSLQGKVAIVTGGSRGMSEQLHVLSYHHSESPNFESFTIGIGAGIARELARRGASVVITYVSSRGRAEATLSSIDADGSPKGFAIQADCGVPEHSASKIVAETVAHFGDKIDIIVNNAANGSDQSLAEVDRSTFDTMFHTNVLFPLLLIKESSPYISKRARIVNISSVGARARKKP